MKRIVLYIAFALALSGCESEIPFTYNSIEAIDIIQAEMNINSLGTAEASVYITSSRDMDSVQADDVVEDAQVEIITPTGEVIDLVYDGDSLYRATINGLDTTPLQGDYTLSVKVDDNTYTAYSQLHAPATIGDVVFYWQSMMEGIGILILKTAIVDTQSEDNYYRYLFLLPSGEEYQDGVVADNALYGGQIDIMAAFNPDDELGYDTMSDDSAGSLYKLCDGDTLTIKVESIDERAYDFLSTLGSSLSNPICHIEGGALGYFSVHSSTQVEIPFQGDEVVELW